MAPVVTLAVCPQSDGDGGEQRQEQTRGAFTSDRPAPPGPRTSLQSLEPSLCQPCLALVKGIVACNGEQRRKTVSYMVAETD